MNLLRMQFVVWSATLGLTAIGLGADVEEGPTGEPIAGYWFVSGALNTDKGPVLSLSKRHVLVDQGTKVKKMSNRSPLTLHLQPMVTERFVEIGDFDASFSSSLPGLMEARAASEMMRHQMGTENEISLLPKIETVRRRTRLNYDQIEEQNRESREYEEGMRHFAEEVAHEAERRVDTLHVTFELSPDRDYTDAYVALAVSYALPRIGRRGSQVYARYVGDLKSGESKLTKMRVALIPFPRRDAKCELFLFHGNGQAIATNLARRVQAVTASQIAEMTERGTVVP